MNAELERRRDELAALCRRFRGRRLEAFGSAAVGGFREETSDLDFLVEFQPPIEPGYVDRYFGVLESLEALFGRPVDLVVASAIKNPYFRESIERTKAVLYEEILRIAAKHGARNVRVFGSVVRGEADQASDVDFLAAVTRKM
ncbi:MAG: nucleotidyltransferase domain-containing protein [Candidatus Acetothermia bacterium]|jgi:predicted nucleotidyltransferase|nr:nucleotidyltransferase domain-containing protein [Candidatus Acetothermia bacterium]